MAKAIAGMSLFILTIILGIFIMIYGWGIQPQNWWWIIGGNTVGLLVLEICKLLAKED